MKRANEESPEQEGRERELDVNEIAREHFKIAYLFPFQRVVIANILERLYYKEEESIRRQVVILPTGAGKSLCFTLPIVLLEGVTLIIFPLLSLIRDQQRRMEESGMSVSVFIGGQEKKDRDLMWQRLERGESKILLSNPETLDSPAMHQRLKKIGIQHLVIDEAHTVSEWGRTFRPSYLTLGSFIEEVDPELVSAFTATASESILKDIKEVLFKERDCHEILGNPDRPNIHYQVIPTLCKEESLLRLLQGEIFPFERPLLIFCSSRTMTERLAITLQYRLGAERNVDENEVRYYHAGLPVDVKKEIEEWFFHSEGGILCSTCAYGMGVDKSNIRTVIHYELSGSVEAYLQETGRAGRDKKESRAFLLFHSDDIQRSSQKRYQELVEVMKTTQGCRRIRMMKLLGLDPDDCNGCDVCDGTLLSTTAEEKTLQHFIRKNRHLLTMHDAVNVLKGYHTHQDRKKNHPSLYGFGRYQEYDREWIVQRINGLLSQGKIKRSKWLWRGKLS